MSQEKAHLRPWHGDLTHTTKTLAVDYSCPEQYHDWLQDHGIWETDLFLTMLTGVPHNDVAAEPRLKSHLPPRLIAKKDFH